jgi:hypothetical protein
MLIIYTESETIKLPQKYFGNQTINLGSKGIRLYHDNSELKLMVQLNDYFNL